MHPYSYTYSDTQISSLPIVLTGDPPLPMASYPT